MWVVVVCVGLIDVWLFGLVGPGRSIRFGRVVCG